MSLSLGNMVRGYAFELQAIRFHNSESAYIAGAFSGGTYTHIAIQRRLVACDNGFIAKKTISKPHEREKRDDWESFNVEWMKYVVRQKCLGNEDFRRLLLSLPSDAVIIEDSIFQTGRTATKWGTRNDELRRRLTLLKKKLKARGLSKAAIKREQDCMRLGEYATVGCFVGQNLMGKILMACKEALRAASSRTLTMTCLSVSTSISWIGKSRSINVL